MKELQNYIPKREPPKESKKEPSVRRARTWILSIAAAVLVAFVILPALLGSLASSNAMDVLARSNAESGASPTPVPTVIQAESSVIAAPTATPTPDVSVSAYSQLLSGDDYPAVEKLQIRLMELGYLDLDEASTIFNEATEEAVKLFQRTLSLQIDGIADSALQELLFNEDAPTYEMKLGDDGADVLTMQSRLTELGYYDGKINGYFGVSTESSILAFQAKNALSKSGVISMEDRELLFSPEAKPKIDPTPTPSPTPKPTARPTSKPTATPKPNSATAKPTNTPSGSSVATAKPQTTADSSADPTSAPTAEPTNPPVDTGAFGKNVEGLCGMAESLLGYKYVYSTEGPTTFDCSGFVYYCLKSIGVSTSRYSASGFSKVDKWEKISAISDLERGDLVFFYSMDRSRIGHTGIYLGGGKYIHASSSAGKVVISSTSGSYFKNYFVLGRRVF